MIIKDVHGETLTLTQTKLVEDKNSCGQGRGYFLWLKDLKETESAYEVPIQLVDKADRQQGMRTHITVGVEVLPSIDYYRIGCRHFTKTMFTKIMKAAQSPKKRKK